MKSAKDLKSMKSIEKIVMLTAYDASTAKAMEGSVDFILVGDSYGMVVLGYENTTKVTMEDMLPPVKAVCRGAKCTFVVADMPINSYEKKEAALKNARSFIDSGAHAVKLENKPEIAKFLTNNGIEVMGHIGLTPQTITNFKVQGKDSESADRLIKLAQELDGAGCFSLVLECIPLDLAKKITQTVSMPTIGIGAGPHCDGQVLVTNDLLGLYGDFKPKFLKKYAELGKLMKKAFEDYSKDVKQGRFPEDKHSFH
jgi:3-methyl-2-oxobutanoate hydroxymethyltransferase